MICLCHFLIRFAFVLFVAATTRACAWAWGSVGGLIFLLPFAPCAAAARTTTTRGSAVWNAGGPDAVVEPAAGGGSTSTDDLPLQQGPGLPHARTHLPAPPVLVASPPAQALGLPRWGVCVAQGRRRVAAGASRLFGVSPSPRPVRPPCFVSGCARRGVMMDGYKAGRRRWGLSVRGRIRHGSLSRWVVSLPLCRVLTCHSFDATTPSPLVW